ncbi:MAG: T9SS type A sorting domain-containing protein [Cytophagaceae bacterium]|jgi:hypothetical protein|nr:T9SS type A sorting domain-containing protein [Cytophagaceae bacterium]
MKRRIVYLILSCLSISGFGQTQLSNQGFEDWTTYPSTSIEIPQAPWRVLTDLGSSLYMVSGAKSTDKRSGNFAIELSPRYNDIENVNILQIQNDYVAFSGNPYYMEGYYKFTQASTDAIQVTVNVAKYSGTPGIYEVLGTGSTSIVSSTTVYTRLVVPITYNNVVLVPDNISVSFRMVNNQTTDGTKLLLDDINFSYSPLASLNHHTHSLEGLVINENSISFLHSEVKATFELMDMAGRVIKTAELSPVFDYSEVPSGSYLVKLATPEGRNQVVKIVR